MRLVHFAYAALWLICSGMWLMRGFGWTAIAMAAVATVGFVIGYRSDSYNSYLARRR